MKHHTRFEVGQKHTNRKGTYEVLAVSGDTMHIRWDVGEEVTTSVTMQGRILDNMQMELEMSALKAPLPARKVNYAHGWCRV